MDQGQLRGNTITGQFGGTTYTKIFVGGLAWETKRDTMKRYFEQFGEILEAVVITDKATGRSKGYGFVTFKDADSAARACQNPSPVIDGRRSNCNLASIGSRPSRPATPRQGSSRYRITTGSAGAPASYPTGTSYSQQPQYALHHTFPYQTYGYTGYSQGLYPMSYYNPHGSHQLFHYYPGVQMVPNAAIYPYYTQQAQSSMHYQHMTRYPPYQQQYPSPVLSIPTNLQPTIGGVPVNSGAAVSSSSSQQAGSGNEEQISSFA